MRTLITLAVCISAALICQAEDAARQFMVQKYLKKARYAAMVTEVTRKSEKGTLTKLVLKAVVTRDKQEWNVTYVYNPACEQFIIEKDGKKAVITYDFATRARSVEGPDYHIFEHGWRVRVFLKDKGAWRETNSPSALELARMRMQDSNDWTEILTALLFPVQKDPLHKAPKPLQGFLGKLAGSARKGT